MTSTSFPSAGKVEAVDTGKIWKFGAIAIGASIAANLIVALLAVQLLGISPVPAPLQPPATIVMSILFMVPGVLAFWLLARFTGRPITFYRVVALIALLLSLIPNVGLLVNPDSAPFPGLTPMAVVVLMVQHLVAASIIIWLLTTKTRA